MHPEPLVGMLSDPAFHDRRDRLHCARDIDTAVGVAPRLYGWGEVDTKTMRVGQPYHPRAMYGTFDVAREAGNERVGLARAPEECDVDAVYVVLVDQHGDVTAAFKDAHELERRIE